jgi:ABC-type multidrug transport system ATPase subunit
VQIKGSVLLDDVSFVLRHGTLLGVIGPSGCGKSTLLKSITGFRKPVQGNILYDGKDLYDHYSELRYRIGMVPQDDVLHNQLTVQRALRFAASLRFATDVTRGERRQRVAEVIELLGMSHRTKHRIDKLSGGQRKRTSVALELLTEPALLALDEPTSGLDPALDKEVMRELRLLADRGRTIMVVTHSVLHLDLCDYVLVMCLGGRMGYFGPPNELLEFFEANDYADVFDKVTNEASYWAAKYRSSDIYRRYVGDVAAELLVDARRKLLGNLELGDLDPEFSPLPTVRATQQAAERPSSSRQGSLLAVAEKLAAAEAAAAAAVTHAPPAQGTGPTVESVEPEPATSEMPLTPAMAAAIPASHAKPPTLGAGAPAPTLPSAGNAATGAPAKPAKAPKRGAKAAVERNLDKMAAVVFRDALPPPPKEAPLKAVQDASVTQRTLHPVAPFRQYLTLCLRMTRVILADRGYTVFLLALPIALAVLSRAVPGTKGLGEDTPLGFNLEAQRRLAVFIVGASFMGVAVAIREIINEASIYRRERAIGLSPTAYLASKVTIFVIIDAIQVILFIYLSMFGLPRPKEPLIFNVEMLDVIIAVWLVSVASTAFALFASAMVKTTDQTTPIMVVSVMFQLVLSGALFAVHGTPVLEYLSYLDPARWGMAAAAASVRLPFLPDEIADPIWLHRQEYWIQPALIMLAQIVILLGATRLALRRYEPGKE